MDGVGHSASILAKELDGKVAYFDRVSYDEHFFRRKDKSQVKLKKGDKIKHGGVHSGKEFCLGQSTGTQHEVIHHDHETNGGILGHKRATAIGKEYFKLRSGIKGASNHTTSGEDEGGCNEA
jgi:hypothetical protein